MPNSSHAVIHSPICKHDHRSRYNAVKESKIKRSNAEDLVRNRHASSVVSERNEGNRNRHRPSSQLLKLVLNSKPKLVPLYLGLCDGTCLIVWLPDNKIPNTTPCPLPWWMGHSTISQSRCIISSCPLPE
jgi:hypothetical protein